MEYMFNQDKVDAIMKDLLKDFMLEHDMTLVALCTENAELLAALDEYRLNLVLRDAVWSIKRDTSGSLELTFVEMADSKHPDAALRMFTALRTDIDVLAVGAKLACKDSPSQRTFFHNLKFEEVTRRFNIGGGNVHERVFRYSFGSSAESWAQADAQ